MRLSTLTQAPLDSVAYEADWAPEDTAIERRHPALPSFLRSTFAPAKDSQGATPGRSNSRFIEESTPPRLVAAEEHADTELRLFFDQAINPATIDQDAWRAGMERASAVTVQDSVVTLRFEALPRGSDVHIPSVRNWMGQSIPAATHPVAWRPQPGEVVINEVLFAPIADAFDGRPDQPEYLELISRAPFPITLRGLLQTGPATEHGRADTVRLVSPSHPLILHPEALAVIVPGTDAASATRALHQAFPGSAAAFTIVVHRSTLGYRNDGDQIRLHRPDGTMLDALRYDPAWHHPALRETNGIALERRHPDEPTQAPSNWTSAAHPDGGTPGRRNSQHLDPLPPSDLTGVHITPSPFSPDADGRDDQTEIRYTLRLSAAVVRVRIFDVDGRLVRTLEAEQLASRTGSLWWDGFDEAGGRLPMGIYVVLLDAYDAGEGREEQHKAVVVLARPLG